ncbi:MAG: NUDIX domain-containing protein [Thermoplasmata archaeon]
MAFLMNRDKILLLRHKKKSKLLGGQWLGISEKISAGNDPEDVAIDAVEEQTGLAIDRSDIRLRGGIVYVRTGQALLRIVPFMIATSQNEIKLADRYDEFKWLSPSEIGSIKTIVGLDRIIGSLLARNDPERKIC